MAWIGYIAATLTTAAFAPQVAKGWRTGSVRDLSGLTLGMMCAGTLLWLAYGLAAGAPPLIVANTVTFFLIGVLVALKLRETRALRLAAAAAAEPGTPAAGTATIVSLEAARRRLERTRREAAVLRRRPRTVLRHAAA